MVDISVPCDGCSAAIRFRDTKCAACNRSLPRALRDALERRLEESSVDFRELRDHTRSAASVVLITGLIYLAAGVLGYVAHTRALVHSPEDDTIAVAGLVEHCSIGAILGFLSALVPRHPVRSLVAALAVWLLVQVLAGFAAPLHVLSAVWLKLVALTLLVRGVVAALRADRALRKLRAGSS